jgi:hypothetical protein
MNEVQFEALGELSREAEAIIAVILTSKLKEVKQCSRKLFSH